MVPKKNLKLEEYRITTTSVATSSNIKSQHGRHRVFSRKLTTIRQPMLSEINFRGWNPSITFLYVLKRSFQYRLISV